MAVFHTNPIFFNADGALKIFSRLCIICIR